MTKRICQQCRAYKAELETQRRDNAGLREHIAKEPERTEVIRLEAMRLTHENERMGLELGEAKRVRKAIESVNSIRRHPELFAELLQAGHIRCACGGVAGKAHPNPTNGGGICFKCECERLAIELAKARMRQDIGAKEPEPM